VLRLGQVLRLQGKFAQAETLLDGAMRISRRVWGAEHPETLAAMYNLATVYYEQGKSPQAEALHQQTLELRRRVLGPEDPGTLASMNGPASRMRHLTNSIILI